MADGFYVDATVVSQTRTETSFPMVAGHIDRPGEARLIYRRIGQDQYVARITCSPFAAICGGRTTNMKCKELVIDAGR